MQDDHMLHKLVKTTLVEQAVEQVQSLVLNQQLQPGDSLPSEMRLAETLGVSRPVVREALRTLAGRGVLTISNGRNAIVSPVNATSLGHFFEHATQLNAVSVIELLEVRRGIEVQSCTLAALRRKPSDIDNLQSTLQQLHDAQYDYEQYSILDAKLHMQIALASQNTLLWYLVDSLSGALRKSSLTGLQYRRNRAEVDQIQSDHAQIVQAIIDRDTQLVQQCMERHMDTALVAIRRAHQMHHVE
jgi:GntR family transcriptional repressor for pyruvate dehydrogenase complex